MRRNDPKGAYWGYLPERSCGETGELMRLSDRYPKRTRENEPQVPPLRFAPVGMTILLRPQELQREILGPR